MIIRKFNLTFFLLAAILVNETSLSRHTPNEKDVESNSNVLHNKLRDRNTFNSWLVPTIESEKSPCGNSYNETWPRAVAIFDNSSGSETLICSGTLVSPTKVVTGKMTLQVNSTGHRKTRENQSRDGVFSE